LGQTFCLTDSFYPLAHFSKDLLFHNYNIANISNLQDKYVVANDNNHFFYDFYQVYIVFLLLTMFKHSFILETVRRSGINKFTILSFTINK